MIYSTTPVNGRGEIRVPLSHLWERVPAGRERGNPVPLTLVGEGARRAGEGLFLP